MVAVINCNDFLSCISLTSFGLRETSVQSAGNHPTMGSFWETIPFATELPADRKLSPHSSWQDIKHVIREICEVVQVTDSV